MCKYEAIVHFLCESEWRREGGRFDCGEKGRDSIHKTRRSERKIEIEIEIKITTPQCWGIPQSNKRDKNLFPTITQTPCYAKSR